MVKSWCLIDADSRGLYEIQRDDALGLLADDDAAIRRARCEASKGRRHALMAVAYHQHDKRELRHCRRQEAQIDRKTEAAPW